MNIGKFYDQQRKYNKLLVIDPKINKAKMSTRKYLALNVKLSALANETQCFKYWIDKNYKMISSKIFDKYIECLSHILTIGLDKNYIDIEEVDVRPNDYCLSDQFLNLFVDINDMMISCSRDHYQTLFEDFISLGISLGFSQAKIEKGFLNSSTCFSIAL